MTPRTTTLCAHRQVGNYRLITIGGHTVAGGGGLHLTARDAEHFTRFVNLRDETTPSEIRFGDIRDNTLFLPIHDFGTVPDDWWGTWVQSINHVVAELAAGHKLLAFCAGGHGRTGLFLASLLAKLEPEHDDPVAEIRRRYCNRAVETPEQATQVLRLLHETRAKQGA